MESVAVDHHNKVRVEFEKMMGKMHPNMDMIRFKSGAYRSHETYRLFLMFCEGWKAAIS